MPPIGNDIVHCCIERINPEQGNAGNQNQRPILTRQQIINEFIDSHRKSKLQQTGTHRTGEIKDKQLLVRTVIGEKTTQHLLFTLFCNMLCIWLLRLILN